MNKKLNQLQKISLVMQELKHFEKSSIKEGHGYVPNVEVKQFQSVNNLFQGFYKPISKIIIDEKD